MPDISGNLRSTKAEANKLHKNDDLGGKTPVDLQKVLIDTIQKSAFSFFFVMATLFGYAKFQDCVAQLEKSNMSSIHVIKNKIKDIIF